MLNLTSLKNPDRKNDLPGWLSFCRSCHLSIGLQGCEGLPRGLDLQDVRQLILHHVAVASTLTISPSDLHDAGEAKDF